MKAQDLRFVLAAFVVATLGLGAAAAQPTIPFKSRELQEGKNYIQRLTSTISVGESSGQASYTFPIVIPQGRGITPSIELQYSSSGGFSEYGWGWELTIPRIERVVEGWHLADGNPHTPRAFRYRNGQHTADLEPAGDLDGWQLYRERREQSFNRYLFRNDTWRILTPKGHVFELGTTAASRNVLSKGFLPQPWEDITVVWLVDKISDPHTNHALYDYTTDSVGNPRISAIRYNGNTVANLAPTIRVEFQWSPHWGTSTPPPFSFRGGYRRVAGVDRLGLIEVTADAHNTENNPAKIPAGSPTTRTYAFAYTDGNDSNRWFHLVLARPWPFPGTWFTYSDFSNEATIDDHVEYAPHDPVVAKFFPPDLGVSDTFPDQTTKTGRVFVDVTSDGRPDLLDATECGVYTAWINTGTGFRRERWDAVIGDPGIPLPDPCSLRTTQGGAARLTIQDFFDLDGDGFPDLVYLPQEQAGPVWFCAGTGTGFRACSALPGDAPTGMYLRRDENVAGDPNVVQTVTDLLDVNGDGLVDSVTANGDLFLIKLNRGPHFGFSTTEIPTPAPYCGLFFPVVSCIRLTHVANGEPNRHLLAETRDINGDGIPDFLSQTLDLKTFAAFGSFSVLGHYSGQAVARFGFTSLEELPRPLGVLGAGHQSGGSYLSLHDLVDVNADGLADAVSFSGAGLLSVRLNLGGGLWEDSARTVTVPPVSIPGKTFFAPALSRSVEMQAPQGAISRIATHAQLADMNGDGLPDFVTAQDPGGIAESASVLARQLDYNVPRKLIAASSLDGNVTTTIEYSAQVGTAPYPMHVTSRVVRSRASLYAGEPDRSRMSGRSYVYAEMGFDRVLRTFTAFGAVTSTGDSFHTTTESQYHTEYALAGSPITQLLSNQSAAGVDTRTRYHYSVNQLGSNRTYANLSGLERERGPRISFTTFVRDDFGEVIQTSDLGDPSDPSDTIVRGKQFVTSVSADRILHLPWQSVGYSITGPLPRIRNYYDELPLGSIGSTGTVSKIESELSVDEFAAVEFSHDILGNLTSRMDELGAETTYGYDPTHRLHAVVETNQIGTIYRSYNTLTGAVHDSCGPQFEPQSGTWRCSRTEVDLHGRITGAYVPTFDGTFAMALLTTVSFDDFSYPLATTLTKRGTQRSIEYRDGFGNPTELRVEETANTFRVYEAMYDAHGVPLRRERVRREPGIAYSHVDSGAQGTAYKYDYVNKSIEQVVHPIEPGFTGAAATMTRVYEGDRVTSTDEDGRRVVHFIDYFDRVDAIELQGDGSLPPARTTFLLDHLNNIIEIRDPNQFVTAYHRNLAGWITEVVAPSGVTTSYEHNARGQIVTVHDPRELSVDHEYDISGRLVRTTSSDEPNDVRHIDATFEYYDESTPTQLGYLSREASDGIVTEYRYAAEGAVETQTTTLGPHSGTITFLYELGSRLFRVEYPDATVAHYSYNLDDAVRLITDKQDIVLASYLYDDEGQPSVVTNDLGLDESYTYDVRGRRTSLVSSNVQIPQGALVDDEVSYSSASLVSGVTRRGLQPGGVARTAPEVDIIGHDYLARVTQVERDGVVHAEYAYDLGGRITAFGEDGASSSLFNDDKLVQRITGNQTHIFTYDLADNVVRDDVLGQNPRAREHHWDALGRYARTAVRGDSIETEYFYSGSGGLTRVRGPGEMPTAVDDLHIGSFARLDMSTGTWTNSVIANGKVVGEWTGPRFEMPHRTLKETVAAITNDLGEIVRQEEFRPFGSRLAGSSAGRFPDHFHGLRADELTVAGGRAYSAETGVWLARDRLVLSRPEFVVSDSRAAHMYGFNFGDPYVFRDPSGAFPPFELVNIADAIADPPTIDDAAETSEAAAEGASMAESLNPGNPGTGILALFTEGMAQYFGGAKAEQEAFRNGDITGVFAAKIQMDKGGFKMGVSIASAVVLGGQIAATAKTGTTVAAATRGGAVPVRVGQKGEAAVRAVYDIGPKVSYEVNGNARIADGLTDTVLSEVKNVAYQAYTEQLRDAVQFAQQTGRRVDLYVRPTTVLTRPLQHAIKQGVFNLRYIPSL